jgi:glycosyltransferase involved in cell wall biosynthesis
MSERRAVAAIAESLAPCLLHTHGYRADVVDAPYLSRRGIPIVSTVHGFTGGDLKNQLYQWLQCRAYRHFDAVVAVSSPLGRQLEPLIEAERLHIVPNGYRQSSPTLPREAARAALGLPLETFTIGWVGRMSREKGADLLLEALAGPSEFPEAAHATLLGDGPRLDALRQQALRLRLGTRVSWQGRVADAERMFSAFDVFVLSSRTEGTPMVVLEAMAAGVPIVATRVGGVPDVLTPGTALLVPPESPAELAAAIRAVYMDRDAAAARARTARARLVAEYGAAMWVSRYETIYERASNLAAR